MSECNTVIVVTERRGLVDDTSTVRTCYVVINEDAECFVFKLQHVRLLERVKTR